MFGCTNYPVRTIIAKMNAKGSMIWHSDASGDLDWRITFFRVKARQEREQQSTISSVV